MGILVAYATDHGSTQGVADRIACRSRSRGIVAEVREVSEVADVMKYEAIVIGSAIHGGKWLAVARQFADRKAAALRERPVWLFSVSTLGDDESMFPAWIAKRLRAWRGQTSELAELRMLLHSRGHRNFAGAITRSQWTVTGRVFFLALGGRYGDHRNWSAIDAWTDSIAAQLQVGSGIGARPDMS